jgi:hypothetical protein
MNRRELVRRLALNSICDDYETVDQVILRDARQEAVPFGLKVGRSEVVNALGSLIEVSHLKTTMKSKRTELAAKSGSVDRRGYLKSHGGVCPEPNNKNTQRFSAVG